MDRHSAKIAEILRDGAVTQDERDALSSLDDAARDGELTTKDRTYIDKLHSRYVTDPDVAPPASAVNMALDDSTFGPKVLTPPSRPRIPASEPTL